MTLIWLCLLSSLALASELKPYQATYEIIRGGKVTGEQTTELKRLNNNQWLLTDTTKGTRGMASLIGFKRQETSEFTFVDGQLFVTRHSMNQKAAFNKRQYQFTYDAQEKQYKGTRKGDQFTLAVTEQNIISAHMLPLALSLTACQQDARAAIDLLKSTNLSHYQFTFNYQSDKITSQRVFSTPRKKSSTAQLDASKNCLPVTQTHQEENEPEINSRLTAFNWL
ncbi:hypothetical protein ACFODZ_05365 [Marinicella sediminis]|uniref:DUF3108 domain-containing protein n=1 Tax=Marinicella sediminis TaxID=1792834 RepID=A0ABV7JE10_9GAMM